MNATHEKTSKRATDWREFKRGGERIRIRAEYGFESMNGPGRDHFSITGTTERFAGGAWREDSGGCIHDEIVKHFPNLADLIPWHLASESEPAMHYEENGLHWWDNIGRPKDRSYDPDPVEAFRSTINLGALSDDLATYPGDPKAPRPCCPSWQVRWNDPATSEPFAAALAEREAVRTWLAERRERLMAAFWDTMRHHGLAT